MSPDDARKLAREARERAERAEAALAAERIERDIIASRLRAAEEERAALRDVGRRLLVERDALQARIDNARPTFGGEYGEG